MEKMKLNIQRFAVGLSISGADGETSVATNTSYINGTITISTSGSTYNTGGTAYYQINGGPAQYFSIGRNSSVSFGYRLGPYTHNADGNLPPQTVSVYVRITSSTSTSGSISVPMQTINRYATITSAPNFNDEENPVLRYNNPAGNNVSLLQACITNSNGNTTLVPYRNISKLGSSYRFELTEEERDALRNITPNANTVVVRFYVKTILSGQTFYQYKNANLSIVNGNPEFSNFDFEDINPITLALTGDSSINIKGFSTTQITIETVDKANAIKGATMVKYRYANDTQSIDIAYNSENDVVGYLPKTTLGIHNVYAVDSRNNSTLVTKLSSQDIIYDPVYVDSINCSTTRTDGGVGTNCTLKFSGKYWNESFGLVTNSLQSISYKLKKTSSSEWINGRTQIVPTVNDKGEFSFEGLIGSNNNDYSWDLEDSYNIKLIVEDELSIKEVDLILASGKPTLSLDKGGVGILCAYDSSIGGALQINGESVGENIFSTNEIKIGTWIDDKPLYRKVYEINSPNSNPYDLNISLLNSDYLCIEKCEFSYRYNNINYVMENNHYSGTNDYFRAFKRDNVIRHALGSIQDGAANKKIILTLNYTKASN